MSLQASEETSAQIIARKDEQIAQLMRENDEIRQREGKYLEEIMELRRKVEKQNIFKRFFTFTLKI